MPIGNHGRAAGHGLDHDQAKRLRPVDGEHEGISVAQKLIFFSVPDFADILDERMVQQGLDPLLEIVFVYPIYLGSNFEGDASSFGDLDGPVYPFFGGDAPYKRQILAWCLVEGI